MLKIDIEIRNEILHRIKSAEQEHNVKVLFAIESGSRAWGFASPNSDYDVRFIYAHPKDWYLDINIEAKRDVIEYPIVDEIDINGWDIRKARASLSTRQCFWQRQIPRIEAWLRRNAYCLSSDHNEESGFLAKPQRASFQAAIFVVMSLVKGVTIPFETCLESDCLKTRRSVV